MRQRGNWISAAAGVHRRRALVESLEPRQLFAVGGDLDLTFGGGDGKVSASFHASQQVAHDVKVGPDEKVCVVLSGGNWDLADLAQVYGQNDMPSRDDLRR